MKSLVLLLIVPVLSCFVTSAKAVADDEDRTISLSDLRTHPTWNRFNLYMEEQKESDSIAGIGYLISGGVAIAGGLYGYYHTEDVFAKAVYSLAQTIGVGAVGYGAFVMTLGSEHQVFHDTVSGTRGLSPLQKDTLVKNYFELEQKRTRSTRTIKSITHGLVALINGYNSTTTSLPDLRTALIFIAGVNLLACVSYAF